MYFNTKKELLMYLGKNPKDIKLVNRMINRGEVIVEANGYTLVVTEGKENKSDLEEIKQLKQRISELEAELVNIGSDNNPSELEEARVQWEYYEGKYKEICIMCNKLIHATYEKHKNYYQKCNIDEAEYKSQLIDYVKSN